MTNEEVMQLVKQGFTADEIRALGWNSESSYNETKVGGDPDPEPEKEVPEPETSSAVPTEVEETIKNLSDTVASLTETVKALQANNQKTAKKSKNENAPKSADEVIKGFIENM